MLIFVDLQTTYASLVCVSIQFWQYSWTSPRCVECWTEQTTQAERAKLVTWQSQQTTRRTRLMSSRPTLLLNQNGRHWSYVTLLLNQNSRHWSYVTLLLKQNGRHWSYVTERFCWIRTDVTEVMSSLNAFAELEQTSLKLCNWTLLLNQNKRHWSSVTERFCWIRIVVTEVMSLNAFAE